MPTSIDIACGSPPTGHLDEPYTHTFPVTGAPEGLELVYTISSGSLPPGLSLNESTGEVTGTPTETGTFHFTICVYVVRDEVIETAILHVKTGLRGELVVAPGYQVPFVSANGQITAGFLTLGQSSAPLGDTDEWTPATDTWDVLGPGLDPALKLDPSNPAAYRVDVYENTGTLFSPWGGVGIWAPEGGYIEYLLYSAWIEATSSEGSLTYAPTTAIVYHAGPGYEDEGRDYALDVARAVDGDDDTYAIIHREFVGLNYPSIALTDWAPIGEESSVECSIHVVGLTGVWLDIWVWRELFRFADVEEEIAFPPGYERALKLQLAAEFGRQYPGHDLSKIKRQLADALGNIDRENVSNSMAIEELPEPPE
jgi:hypothetical protein